MCADFLVSSAPARRSILVGGGAPPVPNIGCGVINFYAQVFQPKQPRHNHTITIMLQCILHFNAKHSFPSLGPSIKYVTLEGVRESVTVCDRGGCQEHVTSRL